MSVCGEYERHRWDGGTVCIRCGIPKQTSLLTTPDSPLNPSLESIITDAVDAQQEQEQKQKVPPRPRGRPRKSVENEAITAQRQRMSKIAAHLPHHLQSSVARYLYNYTGSAFQLSDQESSELAFCWLSVFESYDVSIDSPLFAIAALAITELTISSRQWAAMVNEVAEKTVGR